MNKIIKCAVLALAVFAVSGCKTKMPPMVDTTEYTGELAPLADMVGKVNENRQQEEYVSARMSLQIFSGKRKTSVGGTLRMHRDDVIQLSLVAFGVVEACRIELTPDYMIMIDRMGRHYMKEKYQDIPFLAQAGINFYVLQALFWDELFLPNFDGTVPAETSFMKSMEGDRVLMVNTDNPLMNLTFFANMLSGMIRETRMTSTIEDDPTALVWEYLSFGKLGGAEFPSKMQMKIVGAEIPLDCTLQLAKITNNDDWPTRTPVSKKRYTRVTINDVFNRILSLTH